DEVKKISVQLTALPDLHFTTDVQSDFTPKSSRQTLFVLFSIAIAIIVVAAINFTNFSVALIPRRVRSVNTQKVWGASTKRLRILLITEAIGISLLAYVLALVWVYFASQTPIAQLLDSGIHLFAFPVLLLATALIAIVTGILSGLYPAFYITSFQPAMALKGSFGLSPQGRKMRNLLIGIQFVASFVLIMSAFFMYFQSNYMKNMSLGFNRDQIIVTDMTNNIGKNFDAFTNDLKTFAGIEDVAYANNLLTTQDSYMDWGVKYQDKDIHFQCLPVGPSFLRVMGIKVNEGRDFRDDDELGRYGKFIFNEKARKEYDMQLNTTIMDSSEIVGFVPDILFTTFHTAPSPMAFYVNNVQNWGAFAYIKVSAGSNMREAIQHVRNTLSKLDPDWTFNVRFFDDAIQNVYQKEQHLTLLITLFSAIAILISIIGVFGLIIFETAYRRKEISIRRVLGSSIMEILTLFNKIYLILLGICFLIACPITYYAISKWLENFAYKTPMYWWVFLLGGAIVLLITLFTVSAQSYQAAVKNPTKALNLE
ncbi:MAG: FtsX-like permease family protein, partial [Paludibacter sp.]|nr:FtsX-like permease family protein [Paludibacter sp.]